MYEASKERESILELFLGVFWDDLARGMGGGGDACVSVDVSIC